MKHFAQRAKLNTIFTYLIINKMINQKNYFDIGMHKGYLIQNFDLPFE